MSNWWDKNISDWKGYIRSYGEGVGFPSREWFARHMLENPEWSVLDVGCGGGIEYENLIRHNPKIAYEGVDYTESAIATCKEMFPEAHWSVADARKLEGIGDLSFDVVLIRHTLDHIDDWESALKAAWRVARKEVVVILWTSMFENERDHLLVEKGDDAYYHVYSRPKFTNWVVNEFKPESINFTIISAENVPGREYRKDTAIVMKKYAP